MTQKRFMDFHAVRSGANLNAKMEAATPAVLTEELGVSKGTDDFDVTLGAGSWVSHEGIAVVEDAAQADLLTLADPDASDRIDVIYGTMTYEPDTEPTPATYAVLKGTPAATPEKPTCGATQIEIASIYIPSTAADLDDCYIMPAGALKAWLAATLGLKLEASVFKRAVGDPFVTATNPTPKLIYETGIRNGDLWVEEDGLDIYSYDASTNTWVAGDVLSHAPTHYDGASDPLDIKDLADSLSYLHLGTRATHEALAIRHSTLGGVGVDDHHARDHSSRHSAGGADEVDLKNIADVDGYRHKTHPGLCPSPHGDAHHDQAYATLPHAHAEHTGTVASGFIGGTSIVSPAADTPEGDGVWMAEVGDITLDDTLVQYTGLRIALAVAPVDAITFTFLLNSGAMGTVTVALGQTVGYTELDPVVEMVAGDVIQLNGPADAQAAKGCIPSVMIRRIVDEE